MFSVPRGYGPVSEVLARGTLLDYIKDLYGKVCE